MRVLLDECVPRKLKQDFERHEVSTVPEMGWASKRNGDLLRLAAGRFDVLITVDRSLLYQQNLEGIPIAVISLGARSNRLKDLRQLMPKVRASLSTAKPGQIVRISA